MNRTRRDEEVSRGLRSLPVPDRPERFLDDLRRAIMAEGSKVDRKQTAERDSRFLLLRPGLTTAVTLLTVAMVGGLVGASVSAGGSLTQEEPCPETTPSVPDDSPPADPEPDRGPSSVTYFEPSPGWNTFQTTVGIDPDGPQAAWAANVPFAAEDPTTGFPENTLRCLPPEGLVLVAVGPRPYAGDVDFPHLPMPVTLKDGYFISDDYQSQPAPNVSRYLIESAIRDGHVINIYVWAGNKVPSGRMIGAANRELARLRIAEVP